MGTFPAGLVVNRVQLREQLEEDFARVKASLGPDVVDASFRLDEDWMGEPAIFYQIVFTDAALAKNELASATRPIVEAIRDGMQSYQRWGVYPYFDYLNESTWRKAKLG
jgi:hypothetical protein